MSDYISREAAISSLDELEKTSRHNSVLWPDHVEECREVLRSLPAADVRPVVTCGECKYWELSKIEPRFHVCTYVCGATFVRSSEDFCSRGEKREEN